MDIKQSARGRWHDILSALGVDRRFLVNRHGPCPMCDGKDRFRFDDKDGDGTWFCSHCGAGDGFRMVMLRRGETFKDAVSAVESVIGSARSRAPKPQKCPDEARSVMRELWEASAPISLGTPAMTYLMGRRLGGSSELRAISSMRYDATRRFPGMIAIVRDQGAKIVTMQRTYLTDLGEKAPVEAVRKGVSGAPVKGGAVRLEPTAAVMGIAEGVETALSAYALTGIPTWAALDAQNLAAWNPPPEVERLVIFGDNDRSFTGQHAAYGLARRMAERKLPVEVRVPDYVGDWNDVLMAQRTVA